MKAGLLQFCELEHRAARLAVVAVHADVDRVRVLAQLPWPTEPAEKDDGARRRASRLWARADLAVEVRRRAGDLVERPRVRPVDVLLVDDDPARNDVVASELDLVLTGGRLRERDDVSGALRLVVR